MNRYLRACHGKVRYTNRPFAKRVARRIRRTGGPRLQTYECAFCGLWHLGNLPGQATHLRLGRFGPIPVQEYPA